MSSLFVGLCGNCRHRHWIVSGRGSRFLRCEKSFADPAYPRYPQLPVFGCPGFEAGEPAGEGRAEATPGPAAPAGPPEEDADDR